MAGLLTALLLGVSPTLAGAIQSTTIVEERPPVEPTTATMSPSFSPDRLGANANFTLKFHFSGGEDGIPEAISKSVLHLPVGLQLSDNHIATCTRAKLVAHGAKGCAADSQIGHGDALASIQLGAVPESEEATLSAFIGPIENGNPTIEILAEGYTPLERRIILTGTVLPDSAPYGNKLVITVPAIPTIPLEPNASTISFSLTIGSPKHSKAHAAATVSIPKHCPAGGFPFLDEFTFASGASTQAHTTSPCP